MFEGMIAAENLNLSSFDFTNVTEYENMFGREIIDNEINNYVPSTCYILVKDATAKEWITSKFERLTNVHYVGE